MTVQINLEQLLGGASAILAIVWAIILVKNRLRSLESTVPVIIIALIGIITAMWVIGTKTPNDSKFMLYVTLLVVHFIAFILSMIAITRQCDDEL